MEARSDEACKEAGERDADAYGRNAEPVQPGQHDETNEYDDPE